MMLSLEHRFVHLIPETLEPGILYISLEYMTASHLCCCGCGEEVVTPFSPVSWKMIYNGESISLVPSIGNWNLRCRSHYIIDRGRIIVASPWTDEQIAMAQIRETEVKLGYYEKPLIHQANPASTNDIATNISKVGFWGSLLRYWFRKDK
ncbi:MAG: DUF6527 family protein [Zavarzinella sp.]